VNLVCANKTKPSEMNGWRAPYDQDEVMLCKPLDYLDYVKSFSLAGWDEAFKKAGLLWLPVDGKPLCKETCAYGYNAVDATSKADKRDDAIKLLATVLGVVDWKTLDIQGKNTVSIVPSE